MLSVRSVETGEVLYKIWMGMDGEVMEQRNILAGAWNGRQGYHFAELDRYFPEMKRLENRIMTAFTRVEYPEQLSESARKMYLQFLEQEAVAVAKRMIDLDDLELLVTFRRVWIPYAGKVEGCTGLCQSQTGGSVYRASYQL